MTSLCFAVPRSPRKGYIRLSGCFGARPIATKGPVREARAPRLLLSAHTLPPLLGNDRDACRDGVDYAQSAPEVPCQQYRLYLSTPPTSVQFIAAGLIVPSTKMQDDQEQAPARQSARLRSKPASKLWQAPNPLGCWGGKRQGAGRPVGAKVGDLTAWAVIAARRHSRRQVPQALSFDATTLHARPPACMCRTVEAAGRRETAMRGRRRT